ncbi:acyl-CoA dehydrogenase family protein [Thermomonospora amylolytica]|uniref:acyl-CoA dehydrogenase family protein n=1 Tax=Thermomonospora amylolytica TaxID=1411117 RepID=UPI000E6CA63B|nr:acyl-CoA dehydrogenase [Thermomonospora amylolytica]
MDVTLTEEQTLLAATARDLAGRYATTGGLIAEGRAVTAGPAPADAWRAVTRAGLCGLLLPEHLGGAGAGALEAALVVEELARRLVPVPLLGTLLASDLAAADPSTARALASGERPGCVVLDETLLAPARHGIAWDWTPNALVLALDGDTVLETRAIRPLNGIDPTRALAHTDSATVPSPGMQIGGRAGSRAVGPPDGGDGLGVLTGERLQRWRALALALVCADLVGTLAGALEAAVAHARVREQFGRPVGAFQAVQQLAAEQHVLVEGARSSTWHAAWAVDALEPSEANEAASVAKAFCSEIARPVAEAALQIWGGLGMTWECVAHLYLRRALLDRRAFGDEEHHLTAIAERRLEGAR